MPDWPHMSISSCLQDTMKLREIMRYADCKLIMIHRHGRPSGYKIVLHTSVIQKTNGGGQWMKQVGGSVPQRIHRTATQRLRSQKIHGSKWMCSGRNNRKLTQQIAHRIPSQKLSARGHTTLGKNWRIILSRNNTQEERWNSFLNKWRLVFRHFSRSSPFKAHESLSLTSVLTSAIAFALPCS